MENKAAFEDIVKTALKAVKGSEKFEVVADKIYALLWDKTPEEQLQVVHNLLQFIDNKWPWFFNSWALTGARAVSNQFVKEFIDIMNAYDKENKIKNLNAEQKQKTLDEKANALIQFVIEKSPQAQIDKPMRAKPAQESATKLQDRKPQAQPIQAQSQPAQAQPVSARSQPVSTQAQPVQMREEKPHAVPNANLRQESSANANSSIFTGMWNAANSISTAGQKIYNQIISLVDMPEDSFFSQENEEPEETEEQRQSAVLLENYNSVRSDMITYIAMIHAGVIHIAENLNKKQHLTHEQSEAFYKKSAKLTNIANELSRGRDPHAQINTEVVQKLIAYTNDTMDIANIIEKQYAELSKAEAQNFAKSNRTLANLIISSLQAMLHMLIKIRDQARVSRHVKKTYTTSAAATAVNSNAIEHNEQKTATEYESMLTSIKDQSAKLKNAMQNLNLPKNSPAALTAQHDNTSAQLESLDKKLEANSNKRRRSVSREDVSGLVNNFDTVVDAGTKIESLQQATTGNPATELAAANTSFASRMLERFHNLIAKVSELLNFRRQNPVAPEAIEQLDSMKRAIFTRAMNTYDVRGKLKGKQGMTNLEEDAEKLEQLTEKLKNLDKEVKDLDQNQKLTVQHLDAATKLSAELLKDINKLFFSISRSTRNLQGIEELEEFFDTLSPIILDLNKIASDKVANAPAPHKMVSSFTTAFEKFIHAHLSEGKIEKLRWFTTKSGVLPIIDIFSLSCQALPYYWHHATRLEKVGMVLAIAAMAAAAALAITMLVNPVLILPASMAVSFVIVSAIGILDRLGNNFMRYLMIPNLEDRYKRTEEIKKLSDKLEKQTKQLDQNAEDLFNKWIPKEEPAPKQPSPAELKGIQADLQRLYLQPMLEPVKHNSSFSKGHW